MISFVFLKKYNIFYKKHSVKCNKIKGFVESCQNKGKWLLIIFYKHIIIINEVNLEYEKQKRNKRRYYINNHK